jgi:hypothetical protein
MRIWFQFGVLVLAGGSLAIAQKTEAARPTPPPRNGGGAPKGMPKGFPKGEMGQRLPAPKKMNMPNPGPVERLLAMPPEQRERVLEKLPSSEQQRLRRRFEQFDQRPPEERTRLLNQWRQLAALSTEKREILDRQMKAFNGLPDDRAREVRRAINQLARLSPEERESRLNSEKFKDKFSPAEQQMISDIAANYPFPGK